MSATIFNYEFRARLRSVIIWSIGIGILVVFFSSIFQSFAQQAALVNELLSKFPPELLAAFGLGSIDLTSLLGYLSFLFIFVQLCLAIQASNYGFGLVSVEENELTADFLMTKPVSRSQVLTSKLLAVLSSLLITDVIVWVVTLLCIVIFSGGASYNRGTLALLFASMIIFQLVFLALGLVISLLVRRVRSVTPYGLGLAFGMYIINGFSGMLGDVKLEYITPFKHLDPMNIVQNNGYNPSLVLLDAAVIVICVALSYWLYLRRDIHAIS